MSARVKVAAFAVLATLLTAAGQSFGQDTLVRDMVARYRPSTVFLKVTKTTSTGEVVEDYGTGFVVSERGHVLTSCHAVNNRVLDDAGNDTGKTVDEVLVQGASASREEALEGMALITCAQPPIDLALLKFRNTARRRVPAPISAFEPPATGDAIASMGFPLDTEFFARRGELGAETPGDTFNVDMTLNPGDSGAPVFDRSVRVIGIAEGGYPGARIGVVRPIRHAVYLLWMAGVELTATNANIVSRAEPHAAVGSKVETADFSQAIRAFGSASGNVPATAPSVKITYPYFKMLGVAPALGTAEAANTSINVGEVEAKPGYKIIDAKFIVVGKQDAEVFNVSPQNGGAVARTALGKVAGSAEAANEPAFVKGFVETTQVKIDLPPAPRVRSIKSSAR